jgi:integrase
MIQEMKSGYRKKSDGKTYTESTIECYHTFLKVFKMYETGAKSNIKWNDINKKFYLRFIQWNETRGVSTNYIGRLVKDLKCIMRTAHEEGIHSNDEYRKRYFSVPKEKKKKIPLSLNEIHRLYNLEIEEPNGLIAARDIFVCGCFVGLRISDLKRIQPEHIKLDKNGYHLSMTTLKTGTDVKIPLNKIALSILKKHNFSFPEYSEQSINRNIKVLGRMIGLNEDRVRSLSLHHSRHTFARLAYQQGVPSMYIMKVTGHQSEKSFLNYINISLDQAMEQFRKVELFR